MDELLPMITEKDGIPVTTSKAVAEQFESGNREAVRQAGTNGNGAYSKDRL